MSLILRSAALAASILIVAAPASATEKRYGLTSFEEIEVAANVAVEVVTRAPVSAVATGPQDALDRLTVEARGGKLIIGQKQFAGDENRRRPQGAVTVRVNAANLRAATLVGGGSLQIDELEGNRVSIGLRGPGRIVVGEVTADRLAVAMLGNGTMTLGGTAKEAEMTLSGANMVDAGGLAVAELTVESEGAGDHIFRATKTAMVTTRGLGQTVVLGSPSCTVRNIGIGSVQCGVAQ